MLNDYLFDLRLLEMLGLIMLGLTLLWITISGISSLIQHWRRPKRPDAPAPLPADDREDFIRDQRPEGAPINEKCRFRHPSSRSKPTIVQCLPCKRKIAMNGPRWNSLRQLNLYPGRKLSFRILSRPI